MRGLGGELLEHLLAQNMHTYMHCRAGNGGTTTQQSNAGRQIPPLPSSKKLKASRRSTVHSRCQRRPGRWQRVTSVVDAGGRRS